MPEQDLSSLEKKVGQLFFVGIPGPEIDERTAALIREVSPGGVCLFGRNIRSRDQVRGLNDSLQSLLAIPFLSVDQEGGLVDRLKRILPAMPAASKLASSEQAGEQALLMARALRLLGFNMNFAPVVDVMNSGRGKAGNGLYSRTYGSAAEEVARYAESFIKSTRAAGILDCIKHFPGLGASQVDSHEELPLVEIESGELESVDLIPYRRLAGMTSSIMVAHAAFPAHEMQENDAEGRMVPSSLSRGFVTGVLRSKLGFDGLVITDDLEMGAIMRNYGIADASKMALAAGVDMLAICADPDNVLRAFQAVLDAARSGEIGTERIDESLARIAAVKGSVEPPARYDPERLEALAGEMSAFAEQF